MMASFDLSSASTVREALILTRTAFRESELETADLDARLLISRLADLASHQLATNGDLPLTDAVRGKIERAAGERLAGKPVHRILGTRDFYGLSLKLSGATLEPRPDTETLIDAVLPFVHDRVVQTGCCEIVDLGIGAGGIGLALVAECTQARCLGIDVSLEAVTTALTNARELGLSARYSAVTGDWFRGVEQHFDLIVSNPPYIPTADIASLSREVVAHDPLLALDGGKDGLDAYRQIAAQCRTRLKSGGQVALEIGVGQRKSVTELFVAQRFELSQVVADLGGVDRVLVFAGG
ncbi:protein-(glutamine-N5) methyltransferase, release factor-specific [Hoeflea phototrophica DFL-43]|uniref:Release factor glutamine methyltransferase n=1 Tax=Hoeflea phototrophica (strain DSM 17068 / NCIMB 14078 / DFL-43) TaxID=411684 RepID=A9D7Q2_HOEPD|nr:peptide chain release factor N(5)-glutamine methyltransferase [Hoeflea phototrophica]EDQ33121.1 protein-(glutamine-N5) methyltransferase, release factor-specific [Hoeflea phototrophica DFL-43]